MRFLAALLALSAGCSLVYDGDYLQASDIEITGVADIEVLEGQQGIPILALGRGIDARATMSFELAEPELLGERDDTLAGGPLTLVSARGDATADRGAPSRSR